MYYSTSPLNKKASNRREVGTFLPFFIYYVKIFLVITGLSGYETIRMTVEGEEIWIRN